METDISLSESSKIFDWASFLVCAYTATCLVLVLRLCYQLYQLYSISTKAIKEQGQDFTKVYLPLSNVSVPFSFFNSIFLPRGSFTDAEERLIIAHERVHIAQRHSLDIMMMQIIRVLFWVNPIVYLFLKAIKLNHEFLVDSHVCAQHTKLDYLKLLL